MLQKEKEKYSHLDSQITRLGLCDNCAIDDFWFH